MPSGFVKSISSPSAWAFPKSALLVSVIFIRAGKSVWSESVMELDMVIFWRYFQFVLYQSAAQQVEQSRKERVSAKSTTVKAPMEHVFKCPEPIFIILFPKIPHSLVFQRVTTPILPKPFPQSMAWDISTISGMRISIISGFSFHNLWHANFQ